MASRFIVSAITAIALVAPTLSAASDAVDCSKKANKSHAECVNLPSVSSQSEPELLPILLGVGAAIVVAVAVGGNGSTDSTR